MLVEDGTRLAFALEQAARELRVSSEEELFVEYWPRTAATRSWEVRLQRSHSQQPPYGGYVVVTGEHGGGTSHQGPYLYIPQTRQLRVRPGDCARITLRKVQDRIELVDLR